MPILERYTTIIAKQTSVVGKHRQILRGVRELWVAILQKEGGRASTWTHITAQFLGLTVLSESVVKLELAIVQVLGDAIDFELAVVDQDSRVVGGYGVVIVLLDFFCADGTFSHRYDNLVVGCAVRLLDCAGRLALVPEHLDHAQEISVAYYSRPRALCIAEVFRGFGFLHLLSSQLALLL